MSGAALPEPNDRGFYDRLWAGFAGKHSVQLAIHLESRRPLLRLLARLLDRRPGARFLEVGCGTALDTCLLAQSHPQAAAVAMDLSLNAARLARENAAQMDARVFPLVGDLERLPFASENFDLVFSQGVLEHFPDPAAAMREQARVLRRGGALVVDVPQKFNLYTLRKRRAMRAGRWPWGWETEYSVGELRAWAPRFGLEVLAAVGYQHGRIVDRLLMHPHRFLRRRLCRVSQQSGAFYRPGALARAWERAWDRVDELAGPYLAINVAVAFRKP
jgi:ubiquinone/menaquinone biosynthesis C-methylase UbiE